MYISHPYKRDVNNYKLVRSTNTNQTNKKNIIRSTNINLTNKIEHNQTV